ncbi:MAG: carbamoyltransferase N-terminal domain-containing protein [Candidatus Omnitrophica bacterium]|jgi:carbamoyltransferase|nr:hypothetical protein [Candidatus Omnitrophota bacterium]MDD5080122.1 carbamoyltransferase N-terminal domain-containing protein [Candidatus Omnitrophota bacterium]
MHVLGLSCYYHDAAACLLTDGELVCAFEEERLSRIKHDSSFPEKAIRLCLKTAGISGPDLDYVVFYEKPFLKFERIIKTVLSTYPGSFGFFSEALINWLKDKLWIKTRIAEFLDIPAQRILFSEHHFSHAASAFFCSSFQNAAILTCDGVGEWATTCLGTAQAKWGATGENRIDIGEEIRFPHSLGLLYSAFTAFLGFEVNEGEFKVMGMSAFGQPKYADKVRRLIKVGPDGSFKLDMRYFSYHYSAKRSFSRCFVKLFGEPRDPAARFVTSRTSLYDYSALPTDEELAKNQYYADVAASVQKVCGDILVLIAGQLHKKTGMKKLCLSGGVALNCLANSRILNETPFEEIFIQPAAGDGGGALGAALYAWHCLLQEPRKFILKHAYWGEEFTAHRIEECLHTKNAQFDYIADEEKLLDIVAQGLIAQKVIGWFQGRGEWGPRSLGNRSILADPRHSDMKDKVNIKIKFREPFRPFAPAVLEESAGQFFDLGKATGQYPLKFMLYALPVMKSELIPAVTHADGSSRVQIVDQGSNPFFYRLISRFGRETGVPVLLNTSFNLRGEPIVNSPEDALDTFRKSGMDMLVIGNYVIRK